MQTMSHAARSRAELPRRERQRVACASAFSRPTPSTQPEPPAVSPEDAEGELIARLVIHDRRCPAHGRRSPGSAPLRPDGRPCSLGLKRQGQRRLRA
jgi:hypothetical protein